VTLAQAPEQIACLTLAFFKQLCYNKLDSRFEYLRKEKRMSPQQLGSYLRELRNRKRLTLRDVEKQSGASGSYLSQVEQGKRQPSADLLRKIASTYGASVRELLEMAGYLNEPEVQMSDQERLEWAFKCVLSDPDYKFGTSLGPQGLTLEAKRFIVEMYQKATGRKLL
jgi:transcriptional regulator with XRE-family HTH domain